MQKKISKLPFKGTAEQAAQLKEVIDANKQDPSRLMFVMQEAQGIYGYLPMEVQQMIADGMNVPLEKVYGVATFYAPPGCLQCIRLPGHGLLCQGRGRFVQ